MKLNEMTLYFTYNHILIALLLVWAGTLSAAAQDKDKAQEYALQQEQMKKAALLRELDSAVYLMDNGEYTAADKKFRHVLENIKSVPSDLTYYFGKNSFHLNLFKQSIDWLTKYIQLKGTAGQFYEDAIATKKLAEAEYLKLKSKEAQKVSDLLSQDYDIDCGPTGKVTCPVCKGAHVVITKGKFHDEYKTCSYCNEHGILTCEEYNLLLRGQLQPREQQ